MKSKIITFIFLLIIGTYGFSDDIFLNGGFGISPQAQLTAFNSISLKSQIKIAADAAFFVNFYDTFSAGLYAGLIYNFASDISGGWSYPGFSGIETGVELRYSMPFYRNLGIGGAVTAGLYRYNLTTSIFFLPSVTLFPSLKFLELDNSDFFIDLPVTWYLHNQADLFMSAGVRVRMLMR